MKKRLCLLMAAVLLLGLCACGGKTEAEVKDWTRQGYFADENGHMLSVTWMELDDAAGWYAGFLNGEDPIEDSYGGMLAQEGNALRGALASGGDKGELTVAISEEGADGLLLTVEGGGTYRFTPAELPTAAFGVYLNTDGCGQVACAEAGEALSFDETITSMGFGLSEPATYVFGAKTDEPGWHFVKWTKNGEDYAEDPIITVELTEDAEFVAVFEYADDGQNPVMNWVGPYASGRARALVEAEGDDGARITIEWSGSARELARWVMSGWFDEDTLTVEYADCVKTVVTYKDDGTLAGEAVEYEDGTGRIVFGEDLTFAWKGDPSEQEDLTFEWAWEPAPAEIDCGSSALYTREELAEAVDRICEEFASFEGCELHSLRYAGDESCTEENLRWMNELDPDGHFTQVAEFLMDFHSPAEGGGAWEPDEEYTDWQWWLARGEGGWEVLTWGYG